MCCYCWGFRAQVTGAMITPSTNAFAKAVRANLCIPIGYYQISIYEDLAKMDAHHTAIFVAHANGFDHRFSAPYMLRTNNMVYIHNSWDHYPGQHMPTRSTQFYEYCELSNGEGCAVRNWLPPDVQIHLKTSQPISGQPTRSSFISKGIPYSTFVKSTFKQV